jgi:hypothetical protein
VERTLVLPEGIPLQLHKILREVQYLVAYSHTGNSINGVRQSVGGDIYHIKRFLEKVGYNDMITCWIVSDSGTDVSSGFSLMRFIIDTFVLYFHDMRLRSFVMDVRM